MRLLLGGIFVSVWLDIGVGAIWVWVHLAFIRLCVYADGYYLSYKAVDAVRDEGGNASMRILIYVHIFLLTDALVCENAHEY